jgi:hypothetical protein
VRLALLLTVLAGALAGCGLASGASDAPPAGTPAGPTLKSIVPATGPTRTRLKATLTVDGAPASLGIAGALLASPIPITLDLTRDPKSGASDGSVTISAGGLDLPLRIASDGKATWLRFGSDWYTADAAAVSALLGSVSGSAIPDVSGLTPERIVGLLSDPSRLAPGAVVTGSEDVGGVATSHVVGKIDGAAALASIERFLGSSALSEGQRTALARDVRTDVIDVWVGTADHQVHRVRLNLVADASGEPAPLPGGVRGIRVQVDVTILPADAPVVAAPSSARPLGDLAQAALGSLAPALLGGGASGVTTP